MNCHHGSPLGSSPPKPSIFHWIYSLTSVDLFSLKVPSFLYRYPGSVLKWTLLPNPVDRRYLPSLLLTCICVSWTPRVFNEIAFLKKSRKWACTWTSVVTFSTADERCRGHFQGHKGHCLPRMCIYLHAFERGLGSGGSYCIFFPSPCRSLNFTPDILS